MCIRAVDDNPFIIKYVSRRYNFFQLLLQKYLTIIKNPSLGTLENYCVYVLKFHMYKNGMPCAVEVKK